MAEGKGREEAVKLLFSMFLNKRKNVIFDPGGTNRRWSLYSQTPDVKRVI